MSAMTSTLPQLNGSVFLTEGGLETELIFHDGIDLPDFASFPLVETAEGRALLRRYYESFVPIAQRDGTGIVFETPTWRASADWGSRLGRRGTGGLGTGGGRGLPHPRDGQCPGGFGGRSVVAGRPRFGFHIGYEDDQAVSIGTVFVDHGIAASPSG